MNMRSRTTTVGGVSLGLSLALCALYVTARLIDPHANAHAPSILLLLLWMGEVAYLMAAAGILLRLVFDTIGLVLPGGPSKAAFGERYRPRAWAWVLHLLVAGWLVSGFVVTP